MQVINANVNENVGLIIAIGLDRRWLALNGSLWVQCALLAVSMATTMYY